MPKKASHEKNPHAVAIGTLGGSKGGTERARRLSPEARSEIARVAADARWDAAGAERVPRAIYGSADRPLRIGNTEIPCYVLEDKRRVLTQRGLHAALGLPRKGASGRGDRIAEFWAQDRLNPFVSDTLRVATEMPIRFRSAGGPAHGYEATILVEMCSTILAARRAGALHQHQAHLAEHAEHLLAAFGTVGIIALVDEATGYEKVRDRDELHRILEAYINPGLLPWTKRFPDDFYRELFRLRGWKYPTPGGRRPGHVGTLTNYLVYQRLPPGVLDELQRRNPPVSPGRRAHRHFQFLTPEVGEVHLDRQLLCVITLMRAFRSWSQFLHAFRAAFPEGPQQSDWVFDGVAA